MHGLIYISEALAPMPEPELHAIQAQAADRNLTMNVSGYLYYENNNFIQYLEGDAQDIDTLMQSIRRDPRHKVTHELSQSIDKRKFPDWSMRYIDAHMAREINIENIIFDQIRLVSRIGEQGESIKTMAFNSIDNLADLQRRVGKQNRLEA